MTMERVVHFHCTRCFAGTSKSGCFRVIKILGKIMHREEESPKEKQESKAGKAIEKHKSSHYLLLFLALLGACMIISDTILTPAISVLLAAKGLGRSLAMIPRVCIYLDPRKKNDLSSDKTKHHAAELLKKYVPTPAACVILVCLFTLQHYGTNKIGCMFALIVIVWIFFMCGSGLYNIIHWDHEIIHAISPLYMLRFMRKINPRHWKLLSSIILCIAGSEAMFADLGHFSKKSIKITFVCLIYPVLVLTYAGQTAFISKNLGTDVGNCETSAISKPLTSGNFCRTA